MNRQSVPKKAPTLDGMHIGEAWAGKFAVRYRSDAELRRRCESGETARVMAEHGMTVPPGLEARIVEDTDGVMHVVFPTDPNTELDDDILADVSGGFTAPDVTCASSASTVGTVPSTVFSLGSASTACPSGN